MMSSFHPPLTGFFPRSCRLFLAQLYCRMIACCRGATIAEVEAVLVVVLNLAQMMMIPASSPRPVTFRVWWI